MKNAKIKALVLTVSILLAPALTAFRVYAEPVNIGLLLDLTSTGAYAGQQFKRGAELAAADLRYAGKKVSLFYGDHRSNPAQAADEAQKLIAANQIDALFSTFSGPSRAASPIALRNRKLLIYSAGAESIRQSNAFAFKTYIDEVEGCRLVAQRWREEGLKPALLKAESEFGELCQTGFQNVLPSAPIESFKTNEPVFTQMLKLKSAGVNAVLNPSFEGDIRNMLSAMQQLKMNSKVALVQDSLTESVLKDFAPSLQGALIFGMPRPPRYFMERVEQSPSGSTGAVEFAAEAYIHVRQIYAAVSACPRGDVECQISKMLQSPAEPDFGFRGWSASRQGLFEFSLRSLNSAGRER